MPISLQTILNTDTKIKFLCGYLDFCINVITRERIWTIEKRKVHFEMPSVLPGTGWNEDGIPTSKKLKELDLIEEGSFL